MAITLPKLATCSLKILLKQYGGDKEATWETIAVFYEQFEEDLSKLLSADPDEVRHTAHKMKTGIHLLGLVNLAEHQQEAASEISPQRMLHAMDLHTGLSLVLEELRPYFTSD